MESINPATEEVMGSFEPHSAGQVRGVLESSAAMFHAWRTTSSEERSTWWCRIRASPPAGRELSEFGIREFVNIQTVWTGPIRTRTEPGRRSGGSPHAARPSGSR